MQLRDKRVLVGANYRVRDFDVETGIASTYSVLVYQGRVIEGVPVSVVEIRLPEGHPYYTEEAPVFFLLVRPAAEAEIQDEEHGFVEGESGMRLWSNLFEFSIAMMFVEGDRRGEGLHLSLSDALEQVEEVARHPDQYPALFG